MTGTDYTYRSATSDDIDMIVDLWWIAAQYHADLESRFQYTSNAKEATKEYFLKQMASDDTFIVIAMKRNNALGFISATIIERPPIHVQRKIGYIDSLFVKPSVRRKGIGSNLWSLAMEWLKHHEISKINLAVASKNALGISFWKKFGFEEITCNYEVDI